MFALVLLMNVLLLITWPTNTLANVINSIDHEMNENECGHNWFRFEDHCYYFNDSVAVVFADARQICAELDASIISLHSRKEQNFVKSYFMRNLTWFEITANYYWRYHIWLGGDLDTDGTGKIAWHDGTPFDYEDWDYPTHPSLACTLKCCGPTLTLTRRNSWVDFNCNALFSVACKRPLPQRIEEVKVQERIVKALNVDGGSSASGQLISLPNYFIQLIILSLVSCLNFM